MIPGIRHSSWWRASASSYALLSLSVVIPAMTFSTGCERDPDPGDALPEEVERALRMARGLASQGRFEQAIEELDRAIAWTTASPVTTTPKRPRARKWSRSRPRLHL